MLMRLSGEEPRLDEGEAGWLTFTITDGHILVPCRVGSGALQDVLGRARGDAMTIFRAHRDAMVASAVRTYEQRAGAGNGVVARADLAA